MSHAELTPTDRKPELGDLVVCHADETRPGLTPYGRVIEVNEMKCSVVWLDGSSHDDHKGYASYDYHAFAKARRLGSFFAVPWPDGLVLDGTALPALLAEAQEVASLCTHLP